MAVVLKTGVPARNAEAILERPDGSRVTVWVNIDPVRNEAGELVGAVNCFQDVTEFRAKERAQRFLLEATAAFTSTLEYPAILDKISSISVAEFADLCSIDLVNDDRTYTRASLAFRDPAKAELFKEYTRTYGSAPRPHGVIRKVVESGRSQVIPEISDDLLRSLVADETQAAALMRFEMRSALVVPLRIGDRVLGTLSFGSRFPRRFGPEDRALAELLAQRAALAIDNTRLFHRERAHAEELQVLMETVPVGVFITHDAEGRLITANRMGSELLRVPRGSNASKTSPESETLPFRIFRDGKELPGRDLPMQRVARLGIEVHNEELELRFDDGSRRIHSISAVPLRDAGGRVRGAIAVESDVTERKEMERNLLEAIRAREEFLSIASHELRTPLTSLHLNLQGLRRMTDKEDAASAAAQKVRVMVQRSLSQSERLGRLIKDLLDVSRILMRKLHLQGEPVDLVPIIRSAVETLLDAGAENPPVIEVEAPAEVSGTWDRARLEQVVLNLLSNAVKYGRGQPIRVHVTTDPATVTLRVVDQGIGMAPEFLVRMFNPFERGVSTGHYSGLGLGLYITRQIVEAHGGRIRVETQLGRGSTFIVELPWHVSTGESHAS